MVDNPEPTSNPNSKSNKIALSDYEILHTLVKTKQFHIHYARKRKSIEVIVLQEFLKHHIVTNNQFNNLQSQYDILSSLSNPFVIELKGIYNIDPKFFYFVFEFLPGGNLVSLLNTTKILPLEQAKFYAAHLIQAFDYLHSKNILYRNLLPEHLLIGKDGYLQLINYDISKILDSTEKTNTIIGHPHYLAPEILLAQRYGKPVDWWALGIFLYELLAGIDPFHDEDPMLIYQKILIGRIDFPKRMDKDAKLLIQKLLDPDVTTRYGCSKNGVLDITFHRLFHDFDWKGFKAKKLIAPYIPFIKTIEDTINYPKIEGYKMRESIAINASKDPFIDW